MVSPRTGAAGAIVSVLLVIAVYSLGKEDAALLPDASPSETIGFTVTSPTASLSPVESLSEARSHSALGSLSPPPSDTHSHTPAPSPSPSSVPEPAAPSIPEKYTAHVKWRNPELVSLAEWEAAIVPPQPQQPPLDDAFRAMSINDKHAVFERCINAQVDAFRKAQVSYRSPVLAEVAAAVKSELTTRGLSVTVVVFWGRFRYVSLLWPFLRRNLVTRLGIVSKLIFVTDFRDPDPAPSKALFDAAIAEAGVPVTTYKSCSVSFGCAFNEFAVDNHTVYLKMDDDIIFIKDGSIEHMVYQMLKNDDYVFFSGAVVNNPHTYAMHQLIGAHPATTYHWQDTLSVPPDQPLRAEAAKVYYDGNLGDMAGSKSHEAFIQNAAIGRLDAYAYGLWNLNGCRCGKVQPRLEMCNQQGYYRWSINSITWTRNKSIPVTAKFDEPFLTMEWPVAIAPHRAAIVGESLFVHCQYNNQQRKQKPDYGLRDEILIPWYREFSRQYLAQPFGHWPGNFSLYQLYEDLAFAWGEDRFAMLPQRRSPPNPPNLDVLFRL